MSIKGKSMADGNSQEQTVESVFFHQLAADMVAFYLTGRHAEALHPLTEWDQYALKDFLSHYAQRIQDQKQVEWEDFRKSLFSSQE